MKKITDQHKRLAYRHDPFAEVRIVCTDACEKLPIISVDKDGTPTSHRPDGSWVLGREGAVATYVVQCIPSVMEPMS